MDEVVRLDTREDVGELIAVGLAKHVWVRVQSARGHLPSRPGVGGLASDLVVGRREARVVCRDHVIAFIFGNLRLEGLVLVREEEA